MKKNVAVPPELRTLSCTQVEKIFCISSQTRKTWEKNGILIPHAISKNKSGKKRFLEREIKKLQEETKKYATHADMLAAMHVRASSNYDKNFDYRNFVDKVYRTSDVLLPIKSAATLCELHVDTLEKYMHEEGYSVRRLDEQRYVSLKELNKYLNRCRDLGRV